MDGLIPPQYGDLGKSAKNLFDKGFDYPKVKLGLKTKTDSGVEFEANGTHNLEKACTTGNLKSKLKCSAYGFTFSETWTTGGQLDTELTFEPQKVEGLKFSLSSEWFPSSGKASGNLKTSYKRNYVSTEGDIDMSVTGPVFNGSTVLAYNGWYGGYHLTYKGTTSTLTNNNIACGYYGSDFTVHGALNNIADVVASVHHKLNKNTEVAMSSNYNLQSGNVSIAVGGKYSLDDGSILKAKVNDNGQVGLSYAQDIRTGVRLGLSSLIEARNVNGGGHKLGLSLDFES
ncbi:voltage-dependent anion-selective channel protein 2-like [Dysidea avara]|uniref:voltage-dependent anion-selective channel protein 2-like n=1 Tax=Dysidea avara TaxID=196820 RepID=UPI0033198A9C